ncbi:MAG: hypothetical protein ABL914_13785, partial [Novosphingobium sp.]
AQAVQPQGAAPPLAQLRIDVALAEPLRSIAPAAVRTPALAAALLGEDGAAEMPAMLPIAAPQAALPLAPAAPLTAAPRPQPHDFAALIERLSAARETAAPQAVSISLPHADFGRIQLNFRQEDGILAVSLASADPDFARIAAQAAPPVMPIGEARSAESTGQQSSGRSDGQGAQASQNGNQRGQSNERRSDAHNRLEHQPRARAASGKDSDHRSGIFA